MSFVARENDTQCRPSCPKCGGQDFKRWDWKHPLVIHWLLNPALCVNELLFGHRIPNVMLICRKCNESLADRSYIPCPKCGVLHLGRLWGKKFAFGHWFGYICPTCGEVIPCFWNIWSLLILIVTFPLWYLPVRKARPYWLQYERQRIEAALNKPIQPASDIPWIWYGVVVCGSLAWGLMSLCIIVAAMIDHDWQMLWGIPALIPAWALAGLFWGLSMKAIMNHKPRTAP